MFMKVHNSDHAAVRYIMIKNTNSAPTMKDVAREAGVALGTVSKVMNGIPSEPAQSLLLQAGECHQ